MQIISATIGLLILLGISGCTVSPGFNSYSPSGARSDDESALRSTIAEQQREITRLRREIAALQTRASRNVEPEQRSLPPLGPVNDSGAEPAAPNGPVNEPP